MTSSPTDAARRRPAEGRWLGSLIAAIGGLLFVVINSGGLPAPLRVGLLVAAVGVFVAIIVLIVRGRASMRTRAGAQREASGALKARRPTKRAFVAYWIIIAAEAVALVGGTRLLGVLGYPELGIAWVALVVGTHFFALGWVFGLRRFHLLATLVTVCGIAGFVVWALGVVTAVPIISGVVTGLLLLGFGVWAMLSR